MTRRSLPGFVEGYGAVVPFDGERAAPATATRAATRVAPFVRGCEKLLTTCATATRC